MSGSRRYWRVTASEPTQPLLTIDQVCERLALSRETVRRLIREQRLAAVQFVPGGHLRFRAEDVEALIETHVGQAA